MAASPASESDAKRDAALWLVCLYLWVQATDLITASALVAAFAPGLRAGRRSVAGDGDVSDLLATYKRAEGLKAQASRAAEQAAESVREGLGRLGESIKERLK